MRFGRSEQLALTAPVPDVSWVVSYVFCVRQTDGEGVYWWSDSLEPRGVSGLWGGTDGDRIVRLVSVDVA